MASDDLLLTANDDDIAVRVEVAVVAGGRLRQITVERAGATVELLATPPIEADAASTGWGSFPMAPWAGRIRQGRFRFDDTLVRLDCNHADGDGADRRHAIHGTTFSQPWTVETATADSCTVRCELAGALGWPFGGTARQHLRLRPHRLDLELTVEADDDRRFPASIGWHPWFAKPIGLDFRPTAMYERDEVGLPTGRLVDPTPPPWDDCFVNVEPIALHYARGLADTVVVHSDCDHWVVYDHPTDATCVEPQSGPPDAPTIRPEIVGPALPLTRTMSISWS